MLASMLSTYHCLLGVSRSCLRADLCRGWLAFGPTGRHSISARGFAARLDLVVDHDLSHWVCGVLLAAADAEDLPGNRRGGYLHVMCSE